MKSLNKVQLIGNLTRDPELKFTPSGSAVCTFTVATNRGWTTDSGEKKEEADFTRVVAWNKLAEICGQLLKKGRKVYVEGRLSNRSYQDKDGVTKYITEVVISDMILLDSKASGEGVEPESNSSQDEFNVPEEIEETKKEEKGDESSDDIPF